MPTPSNGDMENSRFARKFAACLAVLLIVIAAAGTLDFILRPSKFSMNDLQLFWIVSPGRFFVPVPGDKGFVQTNPELVQLDNEPVRFSARKKADYRIFCVGGSTTQGWPFHHVLSYPKLLSAILSDVLPGRKVEVINAGFMASDSTSDLPLVREIVRYQPDLLLIYEGRNEWWNYPLHHGFKAYVLELYVWTMRHFAICERLRQAALSQRRFNQAELFRNWADIHRSSFSVDADLTANLKAMAAVAGAHDCKSIVMTQVFYRSDIWEGFWFKAINGSIRALAGNDSGRNPGLIHIARVFQNDPRGESLLIPPTPVHPAISTDISSWPRRRREASIGCISSRPSLHGIGTG